MVNLAQVNWDAIFNTANMPIIATFGMITIVVVAGVIGGTWQKVKQHEHEVQLKRDLAARGYSVDEIERIVKVKHGKG